MRSNYWHSRLNLDYRLKNKFRRKIATLKKKMPAIQPFTVESKTLANNWWGKAWNANLREFTTKNMQLEKGKLYLRCEAVADLKIDGHQVNARVLGSRVEPYTVSVQFKPLAKTRWNKLQKQYRDHLDAFEKILDHDFPKDMQDIFAKSPVGLLPAPKETQFECNCSDSMKLCKHVAAVLFALGVQIDTDANALLQLRGVDINQLISSAIQSERADILKRINAKNIKRLDHENLGELFDIDLQEILEGQ